MKYDIQEQRISESHKLEEVEQLPTTMFYLTINLLNERFVNYHIDN